jgi:hypothetical protein
VYLLLLRVRKRPRLLSPSTCAARLRSIAVRPPPLSSPASSSPSPVARCRLPACYILSLSLSCCSRLHLSAAARSSALGRRPPTRRRSSRPCHGRRCCRRKTAGDVRWRKRRNNRRRRRSVERLQLQRWRRRPEAMLPEKVSVVFGGGRECS